MTPFNFYQFVFISIFFLLLIQCTSKNIVTQSEENIAKVNFNKWLTEYKNNARKNLGITDDTLEQIFKNVKYNQNIISLDSKQIEFRVNAEQYMNIVLNETTYKKGFEFLDKYWNELTAIEAKYHVPSYIIAAFLGIETKYGTIYPKYCAVEAIANLAFHPRRSDFFTKELNSLIILINKGYISSEVKSSWAGALGFPQFMPSTYLYYGVDGNNNGYIDLIHSFNDTFASVANFLRFLGWNYYRDWGYEVILPDNFDHKYITTQIKLPIYQWNNLGVKRINNAKYPNISAQAKILLIDNKTYLVTSNFDVIMKWNKSTLFALAVGKLSDRLKEYSATLQKNNTNNTIKNSTKYTQKLQTKSTTRKLYSKNNNSKQRIIVENNIQSKEALKLNKTRFQNNDNLIKQQELLFEEKRRVFNGEAIK